MVNLNTRATKSTNTMWLPSWNKKQKVGRFVSYARACARVYTYTNVHSKK